MSTAEISADGTVFWASDVNQDGVSEVFVGGTGAQPHGRAWTLSGGRIQPLILDGNHFRLWAGTLRRDYGVFGCVDDQYAQLVATKFGGDIEITLTLTEVDGTQARVASTESVVVQRGEFFTTRDPLEPIAELPFEDRIVACP